MFTAAQLAASPALLFGIILIAVVVMIIAISKFKVHPFLAMTIIAILVGLVCGIKPGDVIANVKSGFGGTLGGIGIVILCGTIMGTLLEKSGAALTMANAIMGVVGKKRTVTTIGVMGYVTGIPVFCDSGFVILSPISRALAQQSGKSLAVLATALSSGLYATHCLVPPTPGPISMAGILTADLGLVILVGLVLSIPAVLTGIIYANCVSSKVQIDPKAEFTLEELKEKYGELPGVGASFAPILLPIVLITLSSIVKLPAKPIGEGAAYTIINFLGDPLIALLLGVGLAIRLIPSSQKSHTAEWIAKGALDSASILIITGAGGSFGKILGMLPIKDAASVLLASGLGVLIPFAISSVLKMAQGSSTVAMITTATLVAPMLEALGLASPLGRVFAVIAIGAGAMVVSHANDSYFWVVSQFADMKTSEAYRCQTGMTACMGIVVVACLYAASACML